MSSALEISVRVRRSILTALARPLLSVMAMVPKARRSAARVMARYPTGLLKSLSDDAIGIWGVSPIPDGSLVVRWVKRVPDGLLHGTAPLNVRFRLAAAAASSAELGLGGGDGPSLPETLKALGISGDIHLAALARHLLAALPPAREPPTDAEIECLTLALKPLVGVFRARLDPDALASVAGARPIALDPKVDEAVAAKHWSGIDRTFERGAALRLAIEDYPEHGAALERLWSQGRQGEFSNPRKAAIEAVRLHARPLGRGAVSHPHAIETALAARVVDASPDIRKALPIDALADRTTDIVAAVLDVLSRLPHKRIPSDAHEWSALVRLAPALRIGLDALRRDIAPSAFVSQHGSWSTFLTRAESVCGPAASERLTALESGLGDCLRAAERLAEDVLAPSLFASAVERRGAPALGPADLATVRSRALKAASTLLFSGKTFVKCLATGAEWRAKRKSIESVLDSLPCASRQKLSDGNRDVDESQGNRFWKPC